jgi:lysophospholipase L1-like esterase
MLIKFILHKIQAKDISKSQSLIFVLTIALLTQFASHQSYADDNFRSTRPVARVEHFQKRQQEINQFLQNSNELNEVKLLFIGDSITDFWLFDDNPWVSGQKYGRKIWDESFNVKGDKNFSFNMGISGDRLEHVLYRILPRSQGGLGQLDSIDLKPEFIILMLGINNSWAVESPVAESVYQGILANLRALHTLKPKSRIVLQSLLPTNDAYKNKELVLIVNQRLQELVSTPEFIKFAVFLNLYPHFIDADGRQISSYFADGLHPNDQGYKVWRDKLIDFLTKSRVEQTQ